MFFFKQKTAYEMRISDWSSDVCSSDLFVARLDRLLANPNGQVGFAHAGWTNEDHILTMVDEPEVQQRIDLSFGDGRLVPVVDVFQVLLQRQARLSTVAFDTAARALGNLVFRQHLSEVQMRAVVRVGPCHQLAPSSIHAAQATAPDT